MNERLQGLHKASLYAVVATAFVALAPGEQIGTGTSLAFAVGLVASWVFNEWSSHADHHQRWWNAIIVTVFVGSGLQLLVTGASFFVVGVRFVLILTIVRLMSSHRARDELQLYALAMLQIGAATVVHDDLTFGLTFAAFVLTGTFSLALFHLKHELRSHTTDLRPGSSPLDLPYIGVLAGIAVGIFTTSLAIFFLFPRIGFGFFETQSRGNQQISGLSNSVQLGSHGTIKDNPRVVMRVQFPEGRPSNVQGLHWQTLTFDRYDGDGWSRTFSAHTERLVSEDGTYDFRPFPDGEAPTGPHGSLPERLEIYVEPLETEHLPTLWPTTRIDFGRASEGAPPGSPRAGALKIDWYGDISHTVPSDVGIPYTIATLPRPTESELRGASAATPPDANGLEPFLQLPREMPRLEQLARRETDPGDSPYEKAAALETFLERQFTYTTDLPEVDRNRPIEAFLFETKRGHCEYYATAMVLMLRNLDIPARLVNGFLGGRWNSVGDYLAVRQGDAHSWVELYLPKYGWVPIDPTPAASVQAASPGATGWFGESYDALRMIWIQWVVEYDLKSQIEALEVARSWVSSPNERREKSGSSSEESSSPADWRRLFFWIGLVALFTGGFASARRSGVRYRLPSLLLRAGIWSGASGLWLTLFWGAHLDALLVGGSLGVGSVALGALTGRFFARGERAELSRLIARIERAAAPTELARRPGEPPAAFLRRIAAAEPEVGERIDRFRKRYLQVRFGRRSLPPEILRHMRKTTERTVERLRNRAT